MIFDFLKISTRFIPVDLLPKSRNPFLLYHSICDRDYYSNNFHDISVDILYSQLKHLKKSFIFVEIDEYIKSKNKMDLAVLTFDDGYSSVIKNGIKILQELDIPATIFINTSFLKGGLFWRDKLRFILDKGYSKKFCQWVYNPPFNINIDHNKVYKQTKSYKINSKIINEALDLFLVDQNICLSDMPRFIAEEDLLECSNGLITYGNHSMNHYVMSSLNEDEQYKEISSFDKFYHKNNFKRSNVFSLPFGGDKDLNSTTINILLDEGYEAILMSRGRLCRNNNFYKNLQILDRVMPQYNEKIVNLGLGYLLSFKNPKIL